MYICMFVITVVTIHNLKTLSEVTSLIAKVLRKSFFLIIQI